MLDSASASPTQPSAMPTYPRPAASRRPPSHSPQRSVRPTSSSRTAAKEEVEKEVKESVPDDESQLIARNDREVILTEFEDVAAHTAKCDLCNKRNSQGLSRCLSCGWQTCHPCTIARGCFRTHRAGARIHTGPIRQGDLVVPDKWKGKTTKTKARTKRETAARGGRSGRRMPMATRRRTREYSVISPGDGSSSDPERLLAGARVLFRLSNAAIGMYVRPGVDGSWLCSD
ncbi:hypothetical protein BDV59DRAFT_174717 [Aspergillus ambiguus]|uniref:uncharacterized protein n=1 Tax=Aspergillus ambiguus TaxID=176160 RepID=UPI003CCD357A